MGMATKDRKLRWLAFAAAGGCILGLVSTFARGAVLSGGAVAVWVWMRSPHNFKTTLAAIAAVVVVFIAGTLYKRPIRHLETSEVTYGSIWQEMATALDPKHDDTHIDRDAIWAAAMQIYRQHPVFGVGPHNFGPYAADNFAPGTVGGVYRDNPRMLYDKALHNSYYQILCELGSIGAIIFVWMLWDFGKSNRALRKPDRVQAWAARTGGRLNLRYVSLALEAGMVAWLTSAYFYNQLFEVNWFYTLILINTLLFHVTKPSRTQAARIPR
jgi:O-antigen ligase